MIKIISDFPLKGSISQEDKKVNNQPKKEVEELQKETSTINKRSSYEDWNENWVISDNPIIKELASIGFMLYMNEEGDLTYSINEEDEKVVKKASHFLSNKLGRKIKFFNYDDEGVKPYDIIGIIGRVFEPFRHQRFIEVKKRNFYKNEFYPTHYMNLTDKPHKETPAILSLIGNLVNNDETKKHYFINWLAYFWQTFKRPQTAIVLKGIPGAGKDVFFDKVITPLFGLNQTTKINDRAIESNFNANTFQNKLFIAFNETSKGDKSSNKDVKNFLKEIITNNKVSLEEKHKARKEVELYFSCLFFTNEAKFIEIEPNDRRFNVFLTGDNLRDNKFLGYGNYDNFKKVIKEELEDFARYLYNYEVDKELANKVMNTLEKEAVIQATTPKIILFYKALKNKDLEYFEPLEELEEDKELRDEQRYIYATIRKSFIEGKIKKSLLVKIYKLLHDTKMTSQTLYKELNVIDPYFLKNKSKVNGERYINL